MPGVFVFHADRPLLDGASMAERLVRDMSLFPWQGGRSWEIEPGRTYMGLVTNNHMGDRQDRHGCREGSITCVVDGHIIRSLEDCGAGGLLADQQYAQAAIRAYRKFGRGFASRLEGQYTVALHDADAGEVTVAGDRHGLTPLFQWTGDQGWAYCSLLGPLAAAGLFTPEIDTASLGALLKYKQLFRRQAMVAGVELYDPATSTTHGLETGARDVDRYWHYGHMGGKSRDVPFKRQVDDICDALVAATDRLTGRPGPYSIGLSGGMDSRLMAGLARDKAADFFTWTYGDEDSTDLRVARILSRKMGLPHDHYPFVIHTTPEHASDYVTITNGCRSVLDASQLTRCHDLLGRSNVHLNGYRGGLILGDTVMDLGVAHTVKYLKFRLGRGALVSHPWLDGLQSDEDLALFYRDLLGRGSPVAPTLVPGRDYDIEAQVIDTLRTTMADVPAEYKLEQFTEEFGGGRHATLQGILQDRQFYGDASVFYDYQVRDLCQSLPAPWRRKRRAYIAVFKRLIPDLAAVEYANTGLAPTASSQRVVATKFLRKLTNNNLPLSMGNDVQSWTRDGSISGYLEEIVTDGRTTARPWWNGSQLPELAADHWGGRINIASELGIVAGVELFTRRWLDRERRTSS